MNSDKLIILKNKIKEIGKLGSFMFRDVFETAIKNAINVNLGLASMTDATENTINIVEETELIIDPSQHQFWRLCTLGINHPEYANEFIHYKRSINVAIILRSTQGLQPLESLEIAGCSVYSLCDGKDKYGVPYGFNEHLLELVYDKKIGEIDFLAVSPLSSGTKEQQSAERHACKNTILRTILRLTGIHKSNTSMVKSDVNMIFCHADGPQQQLISEELLRLGFSSLHCHLDHCFLLSDLSKLNLQIPWSRHCQSKEMNHDSSMFGICE